MAMYVLRLIRTPDKEYKYPRSLGVRVNESRLYTNFVTNIIVILSKLEASMRKIKQILSTSRGKYL